MGAETCASTAFTKEPQAAAPAGSQPSRAAPLDWNSDNSESAPSSCYSGISELRGAVDSSAGASASNPTAEWERAEMSDRTLANVCIFHVPDKPLELQDPQNVSTTSIPMNLVLKPSGALQGELGVWSAGFIPSGARFGPIRGDSLTPSVHEATVMPAEAAVPLGGAPGPLGGQKHVSERRGARPVDLQRPPSRWRIFSDSGARVLRIIDTSSKRANWMRNVKFARTRDSQNLVAAQMDGEMYFYSIKPINANAELLFWFSREYGQRIHAPLNCEFWRQATSTSFAALAAAEAALPSARAVDLLLRGRQSPVGEKTAVHQRSPLAHSPIACSSSAASELHVFDEHSTSSHSATESAGSSPRNSSRAKERRSEDRQSLESGHTELPPQRPDVIQAPLHRPVPLKHSLPLPSPPPPPPTSAYQPAASSFLRPPTTLTHLSTLLQDYYRRAALISGSAGDPLGALQSVVAPADPAPLPPNPLAGGLWVPQTTPQMGVTLQSLNPSALNGGRYAAEVATSLPAFAATTFQPAAQTPLPHAYSSLYAMAAAAAHAASQTSAVPPPQPPTGAELAARLLATSDFGLSAYQQLLTGDSSAWTSPCRPPPPPSPAMPSGRPANENAATPAASTEPKFWQSNVNGRTRYQCTSCGKSFGQLSNLKVHYRAKKPTHCPYCDKRFSSTSNLKTHLTLVHLKLARKGFHCHPTTPVQVPAMWPRLHLSLRGCGTHWKNTSCRPEGGALPTPDSAANAPDSQVTSSTPHFAHNL
ncbi:hypothetical protein M3Y99_01166500 [Aphelenchoides fujianensis]|nr:hypothetical protein M3Y99_01166500 [Aphelenchoides fujianensis]